MISFKSHTAKQAASNTSRLNPALDDILVGGDIIWLEKTIKGVIKAVGKMSVRGDQSQQPNLQFNIIVQGERVAFAKGVLDALVAPKRSEWIKIRNRIRHSVLDHRQRFEERDVCLGHVSERRAGSEHDKVTQFVLLSSVNFISFIDSSSDCMAASMLPKITKRKASRSAAENPDAWISRICFSTVDLPESPAPVELFSTRIIWHSHGKKSNKDALPRSKILTSRFIRFCSCLICLSIALFLLALWLFPMLKEWKCAAKSSGNYGKKVGQEGKKKNNLFRCGLTDFFTSW